MPRPRSKPFKPGDKFVVYIPEDASEEALKFINSPKFISPTVMELIEKEAKRLYGSLDKKIMNSGDQNE